MNQYLIPANSKKSQLIFGLFKPIDLIIAGIGLLLSLIFLFTIADMTVMAIVIKLFPVGIAAFLCMPVPNYHNVRVFIRELSMFFINQRIFIWKGWCVRHEFNDKQ